MDAIVLVGGQGLRLRPLTDRRHKSLVPICNRPAFEYLLDWLRDGGIERVVLALGQGNRDLAAAYPAGTHDGLRIVHVFERERLESGGAIRNAVEQARIDERFVVVNGDIYVEGDLSSLLAAHEAAHAELTLGLAPVADPSDYGVAVVDAQSRVTGFVEKPPRGSAPGNLVNAGTWVFERHLVDWIPPGAVRVEETLFPSLVARERPVHGHLLDGLWADIGTPERYLDLHRALMERSTVAGSLPMVPPSATVNESATVRAACLGPETTIAPCAIVESSVLWERVTVEEGARVGDSVIADEAHIGAGAVVERAIIGSGASIAAGVRVPPGTRLRSGELYDRPHG